MDEKRALEVLAWNSMSDTQRIVHLLADSEERKHEEEVQEKIKWLRQCANANPGSPSAMSVIDDLCVEYKGLPHVYFWSMIGDQATNSKFREIFETSTRYDGEENPSPKFIIAACYAPLEFTNSEYCLLTPEGIFVESAVHPSQSIIPDFLKQSNRYAFGWKDLRGTIVRKDRYEFLIRRNKKYSSNLKELQDREIEDDAMHLPLLLSRLSYREKVRFDEIVMKLRIVYSWISHKIFPGFSNDVNAKCLRCGSLVPAFEILWQNVSATRPFELHSELLCTECAKNFNLEKDKERGVFRERIENAILLKRSLEEMKRVPIDALDHYSVGCESEFKCNLCGKKVSKAHYGVHEDIGYIVCDLCYMKLEKASKRGANEIDIDSLPGELAIEYGVSALYYAGENAISIKKIRNAFETYGQRISKKETILACYDNTILGGAEDGCLLTDCGIYIHNDGDADVKHIRYGSMEQIEVRKSQITINNCHLQATAMRKGRLRFCKLLWHLKEVFSSNEDVESHEDSTVVSAASEMQNNENNFNEAEPLNDGTGTMDDNSLVAKAGVGVIGLNSAVERKLETKEESAITQSERTQQTVKLNCKKTLDNSKGFRLQAGMTIADIGRVVEAFLRNDKKLLVEGIESRDGYFVQAREASTWKKLTGLGKALQVQIVPSGTEDVTVNIGAGQWADKVGAAAVGAIVFAPLLVTSAVGAYLQNKLPDEIFDVVERYIMSGGHSACRNVTLERANPSQTKCPSCGAMNPKSTKFCSGCGVKLAASCPSCGKDVEYGKKFCPHCGSPMVMEKTNACPSCGAAVPEGKKFCSECGASMEKMNKNQCPFCNAMVDKDLRFCPECGSPMSDKKVCKKCGAELAEGQKFCGKCGAKMD